MGVDFLEGFLGAGEDVVAGFGPETGFADFGEGVAEEAVFDGEPVGGGEIAVMDVAVGALPCAADGEMIEEAGATAYGAEDAFVEVVACAEFGCGNPCAEGEEVDFDLGGEIAAHGDWGVRRGGGNNWTDRTEGTDFWGIFCGRVGRGCCGGFRVVGG